MVPVTEIRNSGRLSNEDLKFDLGHVGLMKYPDEEIEKVIDCMSLELWEMSETGELSGYG